MRSLAGLNQSLQGLADARSRDGKDPDSEENQAFLDAIQGKSRDELQAMAKEGQFANRIQQRGLTSLLGSKAASDFRNETPGWYDEGFDKNTGNLPEALERRRQEAVAALPDDASRAAFLRQTEEWSQRFIAGDIDRKVKAAQANRNEAVVDEFRMIADDGIAEKKSPAEIASEIITRSGDNRAFRGLSGPEQNATLYALAQEYAAKGRPDLVKALLENDRGGVGAVIGTADYAVKGNQLVEEAQKVRDREDSKGFFDLYTGIDRQIAEGALTGSRMKEIIDAHPALKDRPDVTSGWVQQSENNRRQAEEKRKREEAQQSALRAANDAEARVFANAGSRMDILLGAQAIEDATVPTASGGARTISRQDQIDQAVKARLAMWRDQKAKAVAAGMSPAEADERELRAKVTFFSGNGVPNPEWERQFSAIANAGSITMLQAGQEIPKKLADLAETYYRVDKLNPAFAASLVKNERAGEFLEAYADARDDLADGGATNPQDALLDAARIANRSSAEKAASAVTRPEAEKVVKAAVSEGWFFGPAIDDDRRMSPQNIGVATDLTQKYMRQGLSERAALSKAKKVMTERLSVVNGVAIMSTGRSFPKDFAEAAEGYLDGLARRLGGGLEGDQLYLMDPHDGTDRFVVIRKDTDQPVGTVGDKEMNGWRRSGQDKAAQAAFVKRRAKADGIHRSPLYGDWRRSSGFLGSQRVKPVVTWTKDERTVRWMDVPDDAPGDDAID